MQRLITTAILSFALAGAASAQVEKPPSDTSVAFDNLTSVLTNGLADGDLGNVLTAGGDALSGFVGTAVTDTANSINPTGGLDLLNDIGEFGGQQGAGEPDIGNMNTLPGL